MKLPFAAQNLEMSLFKKMKFPFLTLIIVSICAVPALHKGVRTVVVPTTLECLAGEPKTVKISNSGRVSFLMESPQAEGGSCKKVLKVMSHVAEKNSPSCCTFVNNDGLRYQSVQ